MILTQKAGRFILSIGWLLLLVVSGVELFFSAAWGADWPLKKVKLEKPEAPPAVGFHSSVSKKNLLKLTRLSPSGLPFARLSTAAPVETLKVLALRVEFQKEVPDDPSTTGLGVFDRRTKQQFLAAEGHLVDPAPHNKKYFESHLEALDRFYQAVSNGRVKVIGDVWPPVDSEVYQLPYPLAYYDLAGCNSNSCVVGQISRFFVDAVRLADMLSPQIDFSNYQSLVIFHAGSSRQDDIFDNTRNDFFTGFLRLGFDSLLVDSSRDTITEGLILPESPSQDNRIVALNATFAHEFGHQLGLVDIYNTRTNVTQVGDFSLMDNNGADIAAELDFTSLGGRIVLASQLLPVYPDAWSRAFLGFLDTLVVTRGPDSLSLLAAELQHTGIEAVKIPISEQEYFLIENRSVDFDSFPGSALKVDDSTNVVLGPARPQGGSSVFTDEYDALLPGSGILIWHVDEGVAFLDDDGDGFNNFESNTVNTNPQRRFLELKEADGLVDFGGNYFTGFGLSEDMYRAGNNSRFTPTSNPSSRNSFGGQTGVSVTGITPADTVMNFDVNSGYLLSGWPQFTGRFSVDRPPVLGDLDGDGKEEVLAFSGPFILAWRQNGTAFIPNNFTDTSSALNGDSLEFPIAIFSFDPTDTARDSGFTSGPVGADLLGDSLKEVFAGSRDGLIWGFAAEDLNGDSLADFLPSFPVDLNNGAVTVILVGKINPFNSLAIFAGTAAGKGFLISPAGTVLDSNLFRGRIVGTAVDTTGNLFVTSAKKDSVFVYRGFHPIWADTILDSLISEPVVAESDSALLLAFATSGGKLYLYDRNDNLAPRFPVDLGTGAAPQPVWVVNPTGGEPIILLAFDNKIVAYQTNGILVEDFPKSIDRQRPANGSQLPLAGLDRAALSRLSRYVPRSSVEARSIPPQGPEIVLAVGSDNGNIYFPQASEREASFALGTGAEILAPLAATTVDSLSSTIRGAKVFARSTDGFMYGYQIDYLEFASRASWTQVRHDFAGSNFLPKVKVQGIGGGELIAEKSFYNYPNPATGGKTYLRYRLTAQSKATLTVYDMAGNQIQKPRDDVPTRIGDDNQVEIDCSDWAAGVYLCRLEVNGAGKKEVVFCKMAVVK